MFYTDSKKGQWLFGKLIKAQTIKRKLRKLNLLQINKLFFAAKRIYMLFMYTRKNEDNKKQNSIKSFFKENNSQNFIKF